MKKTTDVWKNIFLKKVLIDSVQLDSENMILDTTKAEKSSQKNTYQVFEILMCTALSKIYPDFYWHLTPVSKDSGIDVWGQKEDRPFPFQVRNKPIVIYGQIKRSASYFSEQKIVEATNKIIRAHNDSFLQKRNVYKIIHIISSDKNLKNEIKVTAGLVNTLSYIVEIINSEDIFTIWSINKNYFFSTFPVKVNTQEKKEIEIFLEQYSKSISDIIQYKLISPDNISLGAPVRYKLIITNLLQIPFPINIGIHISDDNIFLVAPQNILKNTNLGSEIVLYNEYTLDIIIKIFSKINDTYNYITLKAFNSIEQIEINIPFENITSQFNPCIYMPPITKSYNMLCSSLAEEEHKTTFYSIVGEGGIGKSTLIEEMSIWALNHDYLVYKIEHPCHETEEYKIINKLLENLIFDNDSKVHVCSELKVNLKRKLAHYFNPLWEETIEVFFKDGKIINSEHFYECIITLFILVLEKHSILINISNLHWSNAKLISFFSKMTLNLLSNQTYFLHKLVIIFEGRIFEAVKDDYELRIAEEWLSFYRQSPIIPIMMKKWTDECSKNYIETLFINKGLDPLTLKSRNFAIDFIYRNCKGNPMHIKEAVNALNNKKYIEAVSVGSYISVKNNFDEIQIPTLVDTIKLRIVYYAEKWSFLMDMLIALSCMESGTFVYLYTNNKYYDTRIDWKSVLRDSGFVNLTSDNILFLHENYRTAFNSLKISCDKNIDDFISWCDLKKFHLTFIEKAALTLHKREINYDGLYNEIIAELDMTSNQRVRYQLLLLIDSIYNYLPSETIIPRYILYKQLETAAKEMGSWKTALVYNQKLKEEKLDTVDYAAVCAHGRRNLANIYSFSMQWDKAIDEAIDALNELESFMKSKTLESDELLKIERQRALLYNRLSIAYYFSGDHVNAQLKDETAYKISENNDDLYSIFHIQYERGIWDLNKSSEAGHKLINEAREYLENQDFVSQQEKDLVSTYEKMAFLKISSSRRKSSLFFWKKELEECIKLNNRGSMKDESLEPIVCNFLCGIVSVFLKDYLDAIEYFEKSLTIAGRASMEQCLWMCYLNIAQTYAILSEEDCEWRQIYANKKMYFVKEAENLLTLSINQNVKSNYLCKVYAYPFKIIHRIKNLNEEPVEVTDDDKTYSPVYIGYQNFAFFLL